VKIALVFPPFQLPGMYNLPPLGLLHLATVAKVLGHEVVILDQILELKLGRLPLGRGLYSASAEDILKYKPDLVGFSCQCTTLIPALQISKIIKDINPKTLILFGGHSLMDGDKILKNFKQVDMIIEGEGEETFRELLERLEKGKDLKNLLGLWWRKNGNPVWEGQRPLISDLSTIPLPDYSLAPPLQEYVKAYDLQTPIYIVETGRGCPHSCIYCSESIFWRQKVRRYPVERVINSIELLYNQYGVRYFLLSHDQFTSSSSYVREFCERLKSKALKDISWYCISRLDTVDAELLSLMAEVGCKSMCYGIDSGSQNTLRFIKKGVESSLLLQRVKETTSFGMVPTLSFVVGFPEETKQDIEETLKLALRCKNSGEVNTLFQIPTVLPGTTLHRKYADILVREVDSYFSLGIEFENGKRFLEDELLINSYPKLFSSFYNIPCKGMPLKDLDLIVRVFPIILELYPKSIALVSMLEGINLHEIFFSFLGWLKEKIHKDSNELKARDIQLFFRPFILKNLRLKEQELIRELTRYEAISNWIMAKGSQISPKIFSIKEKGIPRISKDTFVRTFPFDMEDLIIKIQEERSFEKIQKQVTYFVFKGAKGKVEISKMNEFGYHLIRLCNGKRGIEEIAAKLYDTFNQGLAPKDFEREIVNAVQELLDLGFLTLAAT